MGTRDAKPILMVAERTVLTSLKEVAASRVATAIHWETVKYWDKEVAEICKDKEKENKQDKLSLSSLSLEVADDANVVDSSKVAYEPRLGDLEIPNTLKSEIKRFL